jgi:putative transposase
MARISRLVASGYPHHDTQRGVRSMPIFDDDGDRIAYLGFMAEELKRFSVEVLAWCLMTNHTHLIVVPSDARLLARAIGEAHRRYTRMKNFSAGVRGYLFQGRFGSCVLDERHLLAAARYVELNPVNAGIVKDAEQYPWSSARYHLGGQPSWPIGEGQKPVGTGARLERISQRERRTVSADNFATRTSHGKASRERGIRGDA